MEFLILVSGLMLGIVVGTNWNRAHNNTQMKSILKILDGGEPDLVSLPLESQLRRTAMGIAHVQQDLKDQLQTWESILQVAPIGYLHLDEDNQMVWCNKRARELLHIRQWQPERRRVLLEVVRSYELDRAIQQTRNEQVDRQMEWQFHPDYTDSTENGATALKASLIVLPDQEVGVFLENRQPTAELNQVQERWATDLAHELRTPLTSIRLTAETLQMKVEPAATKWLDRMLQEIDRLTRLVQDFLDLSHLEENPAQYIVPRSIRLGDIVDRAWQSVEVLAHQRRVALVKEGELSIKLDADANRLTQVLINLLDNGIRYSPPETAIRLVVTGLLSEQRLELEVIDSGQGFEPKDLPYVFDRLFRGDRSRQHDQTHSATAGNGLGLAIVRQIIRAHQGTITARNHPVTGGGWITITLPQHFLRTPQ